jgi:CRISPR-associated protein Csm2
LEKVEDSLNLLFDLGLNIDKLTDEQYDKFCELCKDYVGGKNFKKNVTTSKIRNIFSAIQSAKNVKEIKLLRPKLAYLAGRDPGTKSFMDDLDNVIKSIKNENEVKNFKALFEAIVCYKKALE